VVGGHREAISIGWRISLRQGKGFTKNIGDGRKEELLGKTGSFFLKTASML